MTLKPTLKRRKSFWILLTVTLAWNTLWGRIGRISSMWWSPMPESRSSSMTWTGSIFTHFLFRWRQRKIATVVSWLFNVISGLSGVMTKSWIWSRGTKCQSWRRARFIKRWGLLAACVAFCQLKEPGTDALFNSQDDVKIARFNSKRGLFGGQEKHELNLPFGRKAFSL